MKKYLTFRKNRGQGWTVFVGLTREGCGTVSWNPERRRFYFKAAEDVELGSKSLQYIADFILKQQSLVDKEVHNE